MAAIKDLNELIEDWNSNQIDWIVALQDPNVTYDQFLRVQQDVLTRQSSLVMRFGLVVDGLPEEFQPAFQPLADHLYGRVPLLSELFSAAATGTEQQWESALATYQVYTTSDALLAFEAFFTNEGIDAILRSQGTSGDQLLASIRRMLGQ